MVAGVLGLIPALGLGVFRFVSEEPPEVSGKALGNLAFALSPFDDDRLWTVREQQRVGRRFRLTVLVTLLGACSLVFTGCATSPAPEEVLARSRDAMSEVQSYRFVGEMETGTPDGVTEARQSGEWAAPDRWRMKLEPVGELAGQISETVAVDQRLFTRELGAGGRTWQEITSFPEGLTVYNPRPESYLTIADLENVRRLDDVTINGVPTFQIRGEQKESRILPERFPPRPEGNEVQWTTTHTWFIAKEDFLLLRHVIEQEMGLSQATHRNTWDYYDYNQPVTIEMPEVNEE